jgi:hypothetical protein
MTLDEQKATVESVNHPKHYVDHPSGIECVDIAERLSFNLGNALKYIWRSGKKAPERAQEDLQKAQWYLTRERWVLDDEGHEIVQTGCGNVVRVLARKVMEKESSTSILFQALNEIRATTDDEAVTGGGRAPEEAIGRILFALDSHLMRKKDPK